MSIDNNRIYTISGYDFVNYIHLTDEEKIRVLELRNKDIVCKWMYSSEPIKKEEHFAFIERLKEREDVFYWVIKKNSKIAACFNISHIDKQHLSCETGMFYADTSLHGIPVVLETAFCSYQLVFSELGFDSVDAYTHVNNKFMLAINQFIGFEVKDSKYTEFCHQYINRAMYLGHQQKQNRNDLRDFFKLLK